MTGELRWILGSCMTSKNSNPWNVQRGKFLWPLGSLFPRIWGLYTSLGACSRFHTGLELWTPLLLIPDYRIAVIPFFFWGRNFGEGPHTNVLPFPIILPKLMLLVCDCLWPRPQNESSGCALSWLCGVVSNSSSSSEENYHIFSNNSSPEGPSRDHTLLCESEWNSLSLCENRDTILVFSF